MRPVRRAARCRPVERRRRRSAEAPRAFGPRGVTWKGLNECRAKWEPAKIATQVCIIAGLHFHQAPLHRGPHSKVRFPSSCGQDSALIPGVDARRRVKRFGSCGRGSALSHRTHALVGEQRVGEASDRGAAPARRNRPRQPHTAVRISRHP